MTEKTMATKKMKHLTIQRAKHLNVEKLSQILGAKRILARKVKYGVVLTSYDGGGFSFNEAIAIAEEIGMTFNGKIIR